MLISRHLPHTRTKLNIKYAEINSSRGYGQKQCHSKVRGRRLWLEPPPHILFLSQALGKKHDFFTSSPLPSPHTFLFHTIFLWREVYPAPPTHTFKESIKRASDDIAWKQSERSLLMHFVHFRTNTLHKRK